MGKKGRETPRRLSRRPMAGKDNSKKEEKKRERKESMKYVCLSLEKGKNHLEEA